MVSSGDQRGRQPQHGFGLAMEAEEYTQVREKQVKEALSDMEHLLGAVVLTMDCFGRSTDEPDDPSMDIIDQEQNAEDLVGDRTRRSGRQ